MLEGFIKLITSRLAGPVFGALALVSIIGNVTAAVSLHFVKGENAKLSARVETLAANNAVLTANNSTLKATVGMQNTAVDSLASAANAAAASAAAGRAAAERTASALDRNAAALGKLTPPPPGVDHCVAASKLIHDTLAGEQSK